MYVVPPKLQDLSAWPTTRNSPSPEEIWEISAPPDKSLIWCVVLSFVISSEKDSPWQVTLLGTNAQIKELMEKRKITGGPLNFNHIKKMIMNFNPFKNQHSFYSNKEVVKIVRMFELKLNRQTSNSASQHKDYLKLEAAAQILQCCIEVYEIDSSGNRQEPISYNPTGKRKIILFQYSEVHKKLKSIASPDKSFKIINIFAFGMSLEKALPLRKEALQHILLRAKVNAKIIQGIKTRYDDSENFLALLLKNPSWRDVITSIYLSPYIARKLEAAGLNTDPCFFKQSDFSAFFYCMGLDSSRLLHVLYNYASNNFEHSDKTTRNPDESTVTALEKIKSALLSDYSKSNDFSILGDKRDVAYKTRQEILCFNEYQHCVVSKISELPTNHSQQTDAENLQRKNKIVEILLEMYSQYFRYPDGNNVGSGNFFDNFIKYSEYYENLDNYTCFLFFDHILYVDQSGDDIKHAVHSLFLTVFGYTLFEKCKHGVHCLECVLTPETCTLRFIPFTFRSKFKKNAEDLLNKLKRPPNVALINPSTSGSSTSSNPSTASKKKYDPNSVLTRITASLKDLPEIKDQFLINRLLKYVGAATSFKLSDGDIKGVLSVQRALQVIGETLNTTESSSVIGHLLCSCLPEDVVIEFFRIRNHCLSKYRPRAMKGKLSLEKDISRFEKLQKMITKFFKIVETVNHSQCFRIFEDMIKKGREESAGVSEALYQNIAEHHNALTMFMKEKYHENICNFKLLVNKLLGYVENELGITKCLKNRKLGQFYTLKFLFSYIGNQCNLEQGSELLIALENLNSLSQSIESKSIVGKGEIDITSQDRQDMVQVISSLRVVSNQIFAEVNQAQYEKIDRSEISSFFNDARSSNLWFTDDEMSTIKKVISDHMQISRNAKVSLKNYLESGSTIQEHEVEQLLDKIFTTRDKTSILGVLTTSPQRKALKTLNKMDNDEKDWFEHTQENSDDLDCLINFAKIRDGKRLLLSFDFQDGNLRQKVLQFLNRKVELLLERISHLKSILIEGDEEISELWAWGRSEAIKTHVRFLMSQRFRKEEDVRLSLEMLLFDCMNILKTSESLSHLWTKANYLFSGASLRDILSHGSTILEIVEGSLDKDDLPSQFIDKMLELIEDSEGIRTLSDLWERSKLTDQQQFENLISTDDKKDPLLQEIKKLKKNRSQGTVGWKDYLSLLPFN
ncbi:hypothetical protein CDAR_514821 [Caerostris darwini]|uniref:Uncharacterized protein n=1 Tax=Caerostris darwini TaxID=1538125 RepID=A0AAV4SIL0_9ARAC|nr:hypothetical protein CDAR_514821 [Caerostris darwini]